MCFDGLAVVDVSSPKKKTIHTHTERERERRGFNRIGAIILETIHTERRVMHSLHRGHSLTTSIQAVNPRLPLRSPPTSWMHLVDRPSRYKYLHLHWRFFRSHRAGICPIDAWRMLSGVKYALSLYPQLSLLEKCLIWSATSIPPSATEPSKSA